MKLPNFVMTNVPLVRHSTLGVGGPADYFAVIAHDPVASKKLFSFEAKMIEACEFARENKLDVFMLGHGSNVLFSDKGFRGLVLQIKTNDIWWGDDEKKNELWADAGTSVAKLVHFGKMGGFTGFEFLAGLPGSVGGAVYGNAGCYGGEFWDIIEEVVFFDGEYIQTKKKHAGMFGYRWSTFKENPNWIILAVRLVVRLKGKKLVAIEIRRVRAGRLASQPEARSIGCIFKNPMLSSGRRVSAGKLIDRASLKGSRIGRAMISNVHGNFFVNLGGAKAKDFMELIKIAKGRVFEKFRILLEEEIIRVGEF